jgi:hypothetical protein
MQRNWKTQVTANVMDAWGDWIATMSQVATCDLFYCGIIWLRTCSLFIVGGMVDNSIIPRVIVRS